jgi:hypothetical protein
MPLVKHDSNGKTVAVRQPDINDFSFLDKANEELRVFVSELVSQDSMEGTDLDFIRVVEDVIELFINKKVIFSSDLPEAAQEKMLLRQHVRDSGNTKLELIDNDNDS